jgi:DNA-cytosine methyltransferase
MNYLTKSKQNKMNVLSLFDGMSCGQIALNKLGINYDKYFACEIDKYAMQVTQHNFPDTIQLGDVQFVTKETFGNHKIDLVIGGSPCQGFSFAGKMLNFDDPRSRLFFEYVRLVKDLKPKYFLLENVKMKKESQDIISKYLGCEPIEINSSLVSAQNRRRLYWTNIPNVGQPEDKGIVLRDIIESGYVDDRMVNQGKSHCVTARYSGAVWWNSIERRQRTMIALEQVDDKLRHPEATKKGYAEAGEGEGIDLTFPQSNTRRGRAMKDKSNCLTAASQEMGVVVKSYREVRTEAAKKARKEHREKTGEDFTPFRAKELVVREDEKVGTVTPSLSNDHKISIETDKKLVWRKLTPLECERLQTVPDGYTLVLDENGKQLVSDSQRYKMLGNGWTVDVITHILKNMEL